MRRPPSRGSSGRCAEHSAGRRERSRQIGVRTLSGLDRPIGSTARERLATSARVVTAGAAPVRERRDEKVVLSRTRPYGSSAVFEQFPWHIDMLRNEKPVFP